VENVLPYLLHVHSSPHAFFSTCIHRNFYLFYCDPSFLDLTAHRHCRRVHLKWVQCSTRPLTMNSATTLMTSHNTEMGAVQHQTTNHERCYHPCKPCHTSSMQLKCPQARLVTLTN
jgi:hypothetical protein